MKLSSSVRVKFAIHLDIFDPGRSANTLPPDQPNTPHGSHPANSTLSLHQPQHPLPRPKHSRRFMPAFPATYTLHPRHPSIAPHMADPPTTTKQGTNVIPHCLWCSFFRLLLMLAIFALAIYITVKIQRLPRYLEGVVIWPDGNTTFGFGH
jgi:hypothetical protein